MRLGTPLSPSAVRLMLLGAGELGQEVLIALQRLGVETIAVDRYPDAPGHQVAHRAHVIDMSNPAELRALIAREKPHFVIEIMLTIKEVFHLSNRGVEGFMRSIFAMLNLHLPISDHTTLSKRGKNFLVRLPKNTQGGMNLVLDSTGLKIYGEGEWKVRKHGYSKHRIWRKLHVGANPDNGEIQVAVLTNNSTSDAAVVNEMLIQIEQTLLSCAADGANDKRKGYEALDEHSPEVEILIPPRKNAHIWQHGNSKEDRLKRDENLRYIRKHGRQQWKQDSGYHIRSLAETIMFRLKTIFGDKLSARLLETQTSQALIRCLALNRMTQLGMPESYLVA